VVVQSDRVLLTGSRVRCGSQPALHAKRALESPDPASARSRQRRTSTQHSTKDRWRSSSNHSVLAGDSLRQPGRVELVKHLLIGLSEQGKVGASKDDVLVPDTTPGERRSQC